MSSQMRRSTRLGSTSSSPIFAFNGRVIARRSQTTCERSMGTSASTPSSGCPTKPSNFSPRSATSSATFLWCSPPGMDLKRSAIPKSSAVVVPLVPSRTLDLALRLQPELRHLFVVSGAASFDESDLLELRAAARAHSSRLDVEFLSGLSPDDLLDRVARLPPGSFVVYAPPGLAPESNEASSYEIGPSDIGSRQRTGVCAP